MFGMAAVPERVVRGVRSNRSTLQAARRTNNEVLRGGGQALEQLRDGKQRHGGAAAGGISQELLWVRRGVWRHLEGGRVATVVVQRDYVHEPKHQPQGRLDLHALQRL